MRRASSIGNCGGIAVLRVDGEKTRDGGGQGDFGGNKTTRA